jgi:hypothetical protein
MIEEPCSWYSFLVTHIDLNVAKDAKIDLTRREAQHGGSSFDPLQSFKSRLPADPRRELPLRGGGYPDLDITRRQLPNLGKQPIPVTLAQPRRI